MGRYTFTGAGGYGARGRGGTTMGGKASSEVKEVDNEFEEELKKKKKKNSLLKSRRNKR